MATERAALLGEERPDAKELYGLEDTQIRHGFVRKVFGILAVQLIVTTVVGGIVMKLADTIAKSSPALMMTLLLGSFISTIAVMIVFACCPDTMRSSPTNYILLSLFTLAESILVGFISSMYTQESVLFVLAATCVVVLGLMLFACQTTYDITGWLPYVFVMSMAMCGFCMVLWVASMFGLASSPAFEAMHLIYSLMAVLLFSFFIVLDTQLIVGGKHSKFRFGVDDYCVAAISLYMDIVRLFLHLLQLFGDRR